MKICAGIVTYNPQINLLSSCITAIRSQVDHVVIIDNGSNNSRDIDDLKNYCDNISVVYNNNNEGIAKALNQIGSEAKRLECDWFLTLDQDSICQPDMIDNYDSCIKELNDETIGMLCPRIKLRVLGKDENSITSKYEDVEVAITSGCLVKVEAWEDVCGFWNYLFIDKVDDDFCLSLREKGWRIVKVNRISLEHEIGRPTKHKMFIFSYYTDSYPDFRYYYIARNTMVVYSLHSNHKFNITWIIIKKLLKLFLGEKNKYSKTKAFILGYLDGRKMINSTTVLKRKSK